MLVSVSSLSVCEYDRRIHSLTEAERKEKENVCLGVALENGLPFILDPYLLFIPRPRPEVSCLVRMTYIRIFQSLSTAPFPPHPDWPIASSPNPVLLVNSTRGCQYSCEKTVVTPGRYWKQVRW